MISGLKEEQNEDAHQVVFDFLKNIEATLKFEDIDICYRLGASQSDKKNPSKNMMVVFMGLRKKQLIMRKKNSLRDNVTHKNTYLNDDLPQETRQIRETLREIARYADEKGYKSKVTGSKLVVDGKVYQPHELDYLPTNIQQDKVKTRRRGDGIAFQGPTSILSNLYPCSITIRGILFNCAEQAYAYRKAIWSEREDLAHKVMLLSDPKDIKKAGDNTPTKITWEGQKVAVMEEIVTQKFLQNKSIAKKLCETGDYPLYEGTTNTFWGCGLRINSKLWLTGNPPGQNRLGKLLMEVRAKLMDRREYKASSTVTAGEPNDGVPIYYDEDRAATGESAEAGLTTTDVTSPPVTQEKEEGNGSVASSPHPTPGNEETTYVERDEGEITLPSVVTSTPSADKAATGPDKARKDLNPLIDPHENMDTGDQGDNSGDINYSINNESTSSVDTTIYKDISTDGVFDLKKIESWTLPSIQRRTAELHRKVNLAKRRTSQFLQGRVNKPGNPSHRSVLNTSDPNAALYSSAVSRTQSTYRDRSFTNSNFRKGALESMGFDTDSSYVRNIANLNNENINDRRRSKQKK